VSRTPRALVALVPLLLHLFAREVDRGLGLVLRAGIEPDGLLVEVARAAAADAAGAVVRVSAGILVGLAAWAALAGWRRGREGSSWSDALAKEAPVLVPLLLRPAITLLALVSVAVRPSYPYGFTLPVALTQDGGLGQDAAALAAVLAWRLPLLRLPGPRSLEVLALSFLAYAALVPGWAWRWEAHPGNEPKYLRQAVALGHWLTFDAEGVSAAMEELPTRPLAQTLPAALGTIGRESWRMATALARGEAGRDAIRATRVTRQTVRGKEGGVYYVLAPGPSLMLAPALRLDRAMNRARGAPGRVAAGVLLWCALAALLVMALFQLLRDATGRPGLAAALAFGFSLVPPFLFYFFQFYPEMVGALVLAVAFRVLALRPEGLLRHPWLFGLVLGTLPWLHQKFLPVWLVLVATALWVALSSGSAAARPRLALALLVPTAASAYLTALYNFAITGSVRPDALFLAWGPGGVTSARVGQGVLGLLLDARYGVLPYVPVLMLAAGGLALGGARRFAVVVPAAVVYYLTVASADNWAGAVCNLGRYFMPVAPLAVALAGIAIDLSSRGTSVLPGPERSATPAGPSGADAAAALGMTRGALALVLMLAAWTGFLAIALWRDPYAANDSALLLAKSTYADGHQYVPNLFIRRWSDASPGLWARIAAWAGALAATASWLPRAASAAPPPGKRRGTSPTATLAAVATLTLAGGLLLERWPGRREAPVFPGTIGLARSVGPSAGSPPPVLFVSGVAHVREDEAIIGPGHAGLLVRAPSALGALKAIVGGSGGVLRVSGLPPVVLRPTGSILDLPLVPYHEVRGHDGRRVTYSRARLDLDGEAVLRPVEATGALPEGPATEPDAPEDEMEPDAGGNR